MKRRVLSMILVVSMVLAVWPTGVLAGNVVKSGYCGGEGDGTNLTWTLDDEGTLTISGTGAMKNWEYSYEVPWDSYRNTIINVIIRNNSASIGKAAFAHCVNLTNISIPNSVTTIGENAFFCCDCLTSISIPDSVTSIGSGVFYNCSSLTLRGRCTLILIRGVENR